MKRVIAVVVCMMLAACGGGGGTASIDPGTGSGDVTVTGKVAGTTFVAVDAASSSVVARHVAQVQSDGSKVFSIKVQSGKQYKFYLVENAGTSYERLFPVYIGNGNKVSVATGTCDLGFVTTSSDGIATPATTPTQFTGAVEDKTIPVGVVSNRSSIYTQADLAGTWYIFQLHAGQSPYGTSGTYTFDANGNGTTANIVNTDGHTTTNTSTSFSITPSGVVTSTTGNTTFNMSSDKLVMVAAGNAGTGNPASITIAVKSGGTFQQSDLTGNWKIHTLTVGSTKRTWVRGDATFNSNGIITTSNAVNPQGATTFNFPATPWTVPSDGNFSGKSIAMSSDKNLMVCMVGNTDGTSSLVLFIKTGGIVFSNSDLTGDWRVNYLDTSLNSDLWSRSLLVFDSIGYVSKFGQVVNGVIVPDQKVTAPALLSAAGIMSSPNMEGIMTLNKKLIVYTETDGTNSDYFRLGILIR